MSFYHDGQPAMGPFRHIEAGFPMHPYPHHDHHAALPTAPSANPAGYSYADSSAQPYMYHHQAYGDVSRAANAAMDYGVWQAPPQAPRLTAAAARAGRQQMMGYVPPGYPQMHGATAWYAQALAVPQPYQQPRTHQQLEHQLLVQHHLAKAHERQHGASAYQQGFASGQYPQSRPHHQHPQTYYNQQSYQSSPHGRSMVHDDYAHRQPRYQDNWSAEAYHRQDRPLDQHPRDWNWQQAPSGHRGSLPYLPRQSHMYSSHPHMQSGYHRHSDDDALHDPETWDAHRYARAPSQGHDWAEPPHHPQHQYGDAADSHAAYHQQEASTQHSHYSRRSNHWRNQDDSLRDEQMHEPNQRRASHADAWRHMHDGSLRGRPDEGRDRSEASQWQGRRDSRHETGAGPVAAAAAEEQECRPAETAADQAQAPAPSSPASLEKSALPIAAIGAQLIWNACTALFDPDLLIEAHETTDEAMEEECEDAMSPADASMPSSSSTPSLNTPDISPWASTTLERGAADSASPGDWNAFRSPFGPDRMPQMRPQAHSFTFGGDHASSHHDLHRMAVGAERARSALMRESSPTKRSRQSSSHSDIATGHSSGTSTASSSEPGTPASLAPGSPAMSSTLSAHSVETTHSPLNGLGMSLDRSRSDSVLRSRRSPSKVSPKLGSSKWSGRLRDNVLAVLRLVSPDWRWSNNDHQFVSLAETLVPEGLVSSAKSSSGNSQGRPGRDSVTSSITSYVNEPSPAFRRFVHQVLAQTLLSPTAFLLGILNALRLLTMAQLPDGSIDPVVLELFAQPTSAAPFKLFTLGMMIANKHLDDNTFLNKTWNEVTGIPLAELNQTEAWFLKKCNYEVTVPDETWIGFLNRLQSWEEKRSSRGMHRDHDSSKRLLLVLDEALSHFDAIPAFKLDDDMVTTSEAAHASKAASPMDMWTKSHRRAGSLALVDGEQHCRSAPAVATLLTHKNYERSDDAYATPHRPTHLSRASLAMENPSAMLMRSNTELVTAAASPFKQISPLSESGKSQIGSMSGPLMPSALLNGSRALFQHGGMFGPLSTSAWAHP